MDINKKYLKVYSLVSLSSWFEYYDFIIYGMMAKYLEEVFFPDNCYNHGLINIFYIFIIGYVVRPIGGLIFGIFADFYGRRITFICVMLIMSIATIGIGLLPSYNQAGITGSIGLIIFRFLQGVSIGAELPGAITIVNEFKPNKMGYLSSLILSGTAIGSLLATYTLFLMNHYFTIEEISNGIWRLPFIFGGLLSLTIFYIRRNIFETPEFIKCKELNKNNKSKLLSNKNFVNVILGIGIVYYFSTMVITNLYFPIYLKEYFTYKPEDIYHAVTVSIIAAIVFLLIFGFISDYFSKIKLLIFSLLGSILLIIPMYKLLEMQTYTSLHLFFIIYQMQITFYATNCLPILSNLFNTDIRYTATALSYNLAYSLASTIPIICTYLSRNLNSPYYLGIVFIVAILIALFSVSILIFKKYYK